MPISGLLLSLLFVGALVTSAQAGDSQPPTVGWADLRPPMTEKCERMIRRLRRPEGCTNPAAERLAFLGMMHLGCGQDTTGADEGAIRIAGYVHPLEFKFRDVRRFFLMPPATYCPHSPPPPPNQLILVETDKGIDVNADPVFITGVIRASRTKTDLATAAYVMKAERIDQATRPDADTEGW